MKTAPATQIDFLASSWLGIDRDDSVIDLKLMSELFGEPVRFKTDRTDRRDTKLIIDSAAYPDSPPVLIARSLEGLMRTRMMLNILHKAMLEQALISNILAGVLKQQDVRACEAALDEIKKYER